MIAAVTFDATGTLIALGEPPGATYARFARRFGIPAQPKRIEHDFRRALAAAPPLAFPGACANALPDLERAWWRGIVGGALGLAPDDPRLERCFGALFEHFARPAAWRVYPDVVPTLRSLRKRGLRLAVISNFDGRLPCLLDGLGLASHLDAVVWSTAVGAAKPDPGIFVAASRRLGVVASLTCHVGDDPIADVSGARAAGAAGLLLDRTGRTSDAIAGLGELDQRLAGTRP